MKPIRKRVPKAFGELYESIQDYSQGHNGNPVTTADAPHAGAVEKGSPPHKPDFERLLAWVKLRGMQGLNRNQTPPGSKRMRFGHGRGPTTRQQARRIAQMFREQVVRAKPGSRKRGGLTNFAYRFLNTGYKPRPGAVGRHSPIDAPYQIALAISRKIEKYGTKPHWYVRESLPEIQAILKGEIAKELARASSKAAPAMRVKDSELY